MSAESIAVHIGIERITYKRRPEMGNVEVIVYFADGIPYAWTDHSIEKATAYAIYSKLKDKGMPLPVEQMVADIDKEADQ